MSYRGGRTNSEQAICILCDWWWLFLLILGLIAAAIFTRNLWQPWITGEPVLGTGDIQVTLRWSGQNDLDLHVEDPSGEIIFYGNRASSTGAILDVDTNAGCGGNMTNSPVENIYWPLRSAPQGSYRVRVVYYAQCTDQESTPFEVTLLNNGQTQTFTGVLDMNTRSVDLYQFTR